MKFSRKICGCSKMVLAAVVVFTSLSLSAARHYYVNADPTKASDDYDGSAPEWAGGDSKIGPKLTLQGAMSISELDSGDTVHAAAGVYDRGGVELSNGASNRVSVKSGVMLIGAGADKTTIKGKFGSGDNGIGSGAMRGVYLYRHAVIQGFTITGGRTVGTGDAQKNRGAGIDGDIGLAADCIFSGNRAGHRGSAATGNNTLLRCIIRETEGDYGIYDRTQMLDCVYDCVKAPYSSVAACNCLFIRTAVQGGNANSREKVYNSIIIGNSGWYTAFYNCRLSDKIRTTDNNSTNADGMSIDGIAKLSSMYDLETFRPVAGSSLIDAGNNEYYSNFTNGWPALWHPFAGKDFAGRFRVAGSAVDIGPGEYSWADSNAEGMTIEAEDLADGTTKVSVNRNFDSEKLCTGFVFNGVTVEFGKNGVGESWTYSAPSELFGQEDFTPLYCYPITHLYVNPDPLKGSDSNRGYHPDCPKKTLAAAAECAKSGDVIHAAKGVYCEGDELVGETRTRVVLKAGVGLVSDYGAEETAIEGVLSSEPGMSGPDSVRCAVVRSGAYIKGFTIRNGSTRVGSNNIYGESGGGVTGSGAVIDCVITNCYGVRGGGAEDVVLIRCRLRDCHPSIGATNSTGTVADHIDAGVSGGRIFDSYINSKVFNVLEIRNSFVNNVWDNKADNGYSRVYNSYVVSSYGSVAFTNCIVAEASRDTYITKETLFDKKMLFDANLRPLSSDALGVDAGDLQHYVYTQTFAHEAGLDISGGQRVYNGRIDIGPGEYDWREIYAKKLRRRGIDVAAVSPSVVAAGDAGLSLGSGDSVTLALIFGVDGVCSFKVECSGSVEVKADGVVLSPADGVYSFAGKAEDDHTVTVVCNDGNALVGDFCIPGPGLVIRIK